MAATIGHLAVLISAQTAPLTKDMNKAAKIAGDGAKKMQDEVGKRGGPSMWGNFFRGAFLLGMFHKMVGAVKAGVEALEKSGDVAAVAARKGLNDYDAAIGRITGSLAKSLAPAIARSAQGLATLAEAFEDLIDVYQFDVFGSGLDKELSRRVEAQREYTKQLRLQKEAAAALALQQDEIGFFNPQVEALDSAFRKHEKYIERVEAGLKMGAIFNRMTADALIDASRTEALKSIGAAFDDAPIEKYFQTLRDINKAFDRLKMSTEEWTDLTTKATEQFLESSGLSVKSEFDVYLEKVEMLNRLRRTGWIEEEQYARMLGAQVEKLAATQEKLAESKAPEALIKGSAAAYSAINEFQRGKPGGGKDAAEIIKRAAAEQAERDAEQIRIGREANRHLAKFANIEAMGP